MLKRRGTESSGNWCWSLALLAALGAGPEAVAQESPELVTDRPDQTESSSVVPTGTVQVESGVLVTEDETELLGSLVRWGLAERLEVRFGWDGWIDRDVDGGPGAEGIGDGEVGVKVALALERGRRPETALLVSTSVPFQDDEVGSGRADPSFRFLFSHTLPDGWALGYNLGAAWDDDDVAAEYTAALGRGVGERWGVFIELFGEVPVDGPGGDAHSLDGGVTYAVGPRLQLDLAGGVGLAGDAPDWFLGAGVSFRVPE